MVDVLHRCGSKAIRGIVVKSLSELLLYGDTSSDYISQRLLVACMHACVVRTPSFSKYTRRVPWSLHRCGLTATHVS